MGRGKGSWSKLAHETAWARLQEAQKKPNSYAKKKQLLDNITDDFPRY